MLAHRKALVAVLAGAGLCVAFLTVYLCRETLLELWYERQLRSDDPEARRRAAVGLLGMKSVRSLAILLEYVETPDPRDPNVSDEEFHIQRFSRVVVARGSAVVPQLREALVERVGRFRAKGLILDVTALDVMDSFGVRTLRDLAHMTRLRGAETVIVGIQPEVAFAMVQLGLSLKGIATALDLEEGLAFLNARTRGGDHA